MAKLFSTTEHVEEMSDEMLAQSRFMIITEHSIRVGRVGIESTDSAVNILRDRFGAGIEHCHRESAFVQLIIEISWGGDLVHLGDYLAEHQFRLLVEN
jgi:hypothetical protein